MRGEHMIKKKLILLILFFSFGSFTQTIALVNSCIYLFYHQAPNKTNLLTTCC